MQKFFASVFSVINQAVRNKGLKTYFLIGPAWALVVKLALFVHHAGGTVFQAGGDGFVFGIN